MSDQRGLSVPPSLGLATWGDRGLVWLASPPNNHCARTPSSRDWGTSFAPGAWPVPPPCWGTPGAPYAAGIDGLWSWLSTWRKQVLPCLAGTSDGCCWAPLPTLLALEAHPLTALSNSVRSLLLRCANRMSSTSPSKSGATVNWAWLPNVRGVCRGCRHARSAAFWTRPI